MGLVYTVANGGNMRNNGQHKVSGNLDDEQYVHLTMQGTDDNNALVSVGQTCDAGYTVICRQNGDELISPDKRKLTFKIENCVCKVNDIVRTTQREGRHDTGSCTTCQYSKCPTSRRCSGTSRIQVRHPHGLRGS